MQVKSEWLQKNNNYKCPHCGKEYSKNGISTHIWRKHTNEGIEFTKNHDPNIGFKNGTRKSRNKGLTKETDESINRACETKKRKFKSGELISAFKGKHHTEESKEKIRKARFEYLKLKTGNTAWEKVQRGELTYLEQRFYDELKKHNLFKKYDIIYNLCEYPYFLDFAFLNIKFAVEMDGACHFSNGKRIQHDIDRDKTLDKKGWKMFRIAYNDNWEEKIDELFIILNDINNYIPKSLEDRLYIRSEYKKEKVKKEKVVDYNIINNINLVINSDINFSKQGWTQEVAKIINKQPQKVTQWMRKYMFDFWNEKCFKRKGTKESNS